MILVKAVQNYFDTFAISKEFIYVNIRDKPNTLG